MWRCSPTSFNLWIYGRSYSHCFRLTLRFGDIQNDEWVRLVNRLLRLCA